MFGNGIGILGKHRSDKLFPSEDSKFSTAFVMFNSYNIIVNIALVINT